MGGTSGALAAVLAAERLGLEVLTVSGPEKLLDDYLLSFTGELDAADTVREPARERLPLCPIDGPAQARAPFDFFGATLRDWATSCLGSAGGLLSTTLLDPQLAHDFRSADQLVRVVPVDAVAPAELEAPLTEWLQDRLAEPDPFESAPRVQQLVLHGSQVCGVLADDRTVGTRFGVLIPVGPPAAQWPEVPAGTGSAQLAFVTRPASRFARLELLWTENPAG